MTRRDEEAVHGSGAARTARGPVPSAAQWLGALGAVPFVALAVMALFVDGAPSTRVSVALSAYGAVILSFLGGIRWGLAVAGFGVEGGEGASFGRLGLSVLPSLVAWVALLIPAPGRLLLLAAAFAAMLWLDVRASRQGIAPVWYPRLRWPLTTTVVAALVLAAIA